jgi:wyosine [tRNA(Phe)-imidazoG37] synthetase (radical SAM superfamily)
MTTLTTEETSFHQSDSTVYGPVYSWRVGWSLGIDLLYRSSICSFNCMYCQLGSIQERILERAVFVSTETVLADLETSDWQKADVITFSGNGEPTLALNLGECIREIKARTQKPVMVLTNATLLVDPQVREELLAADRVACKLDAASETVYQRMNRPVAGVTLERSLEGIRLFRDSDFQGKLSIQCMLMPANEAEAEAIADLALSLRPDEIQLNTPKRPYPLEWHLENRGNHDHVSVPSQTLRTISPERAQALQAFILNRNESMSVKAFTKPEVRS